MRESLSTADQQTNLGRPMRLLLDARKLGHGGIGTYLDRLIEAFKQSPEISFALVVSPEVAADPFLRRKFGLEGLRVIPEAAASYSLKEYYQMPKRLPFEDFDIFHVPHYTLPYRIPIPTVVTIHDAIHVSHPEKFYYPFIAKKLIRSAMRRATKVIADSHATAWHLRSMVKASSKDRSKVSVVPVMIDPFYSVDLLTSESSVTLDLPERYFLIVCSQPKPHKGLDDLLEVAKAFFKAGNRDGIKLLVVGSGSKLVESKLKGSYEFLKSHVECRGFVSKHDLRLMYFHARGVIIPSRAEGFGLPVLEARAMGLPVLVRPVPALCELIDRDSTIVAEDFSLPALLQGLEKMYERYAGKKYFIEPEQLEQFSATEVTPQMLSVYRASLTEGV